MLGRKLNIISSMAILREVGDDKDTVHGCIAMVNDCCRHKKTRCILLMRAQEKALVDEYLASYTAETKPLVVEIKLLKRLFDSYDREVYRQTLRAFAKLCCTAARSSVGIE